MRVGYGISNSDIISVLHKVRPPFNITTLSLAGAIEALKHESFVTMGIEKNFSEMKRYEEYATSKGYDLFHRIQILSLFIWMDIFQKRWLWSFLSLE